MLEIQTLIKTQDDFKQAILNESNAFLHIAIINTYNIKEKELTEIIRKAIEGNPKEIVFKTNTELSKMSELELVTYGITIGADVNTRYSKAKNLENIKAKLI